MLYRPRPCRLLLAFAFALLLTSCAAPPAAPTPALQSARFAEIVTTLADPAMEGRDAGTEGIDRARDYLVTQFQALGLRPTFGEEYTQPFDVALGVRATEQSLTIAGDSITALDAKPDDAFSPLGFSAQGAFEGEAVFAGYGITSEANDYDSYTGAGAHVRDKVVIVYRYEPRDENGRSLWRRDAQGQARSGWTRHAEFATKAALAAEHGAAALLIVNPPSTDGGSSLVTPTRSAGPAEAAIPVMHISGELFRGILQRAGRQPLRTSRVYEQRANEGKAMSPHGVDLLAGVRIRGRVALDRSGATVSNVAAYLPGRGSLAREVVVVGAHYDHVGYGAFGSRTREQALHPGADDNASGVAALVMLAESLTRAARRGDDDRRGVLFVAFAGEERGLLGSRHFVESLTDITVLHRAGLRRDQIVAMVNMDMVGRLRDDQLMVLGVGTGDAWRQLVLAAAAPHDLSIDPGDSSSGRSDDLQFSLREIPAVHLFTGAHEDYHTPADTADKVNAAGGARIAAMAGDLTLALATRSERLAFVEQPTGEHGGVDLGHGARLGIIPDYARSNEGGCTIDQALPGGPADHAGLRSDDVITAWDGEPINNIHDLMRALSQHNPGDVVTLSVQRADETLELPVTLGAR